MVKITVGDNSNVYIGVSIRKIIFEVIMWLVKWSSDARDDVAVQRRRMKP